MAPGTAHAARGHPQGRSLCALEAQQRSAAAACEPPAAPGHPRSPSQRAAGVPSAVGTPGGAGALRDGRLTARIVWRRQPVPPPTTPEQGLGPPRDPGDLQHHRRPPCSRMAESPPPGSWNLLVTRSVPASHASTVPSALQEYTWLGAGAARQARESAGSVRTRTRAELPLKRPQRGRVRGQRTRLTGQESVSSWDVRFHGRRRVYVSRRRWPHGDRPPADV